MPENQLCKICNAPALFINFGARSCSSCKMFFKRNAELPKEIFSCKFENCCEMNISTRRLCSSCRLAKCFTSGMQTRLIRGFRGRKNRKRTLTSLIQLPTLNLLQADHSCLTMNQWILLSNLIHTYDEYNNLSVAQRFIIEQNSLPIKQRYRLEPVAEFVTSNMQQIEKIFENNRDLRSLDSHDRLILLRRTIKHAGCFGATFILHQSQILDDPLFFTTNEILFTPTVMSTIQPITHLYDSDITFNKLILLLLIFSTISYTNLSTDFNENLYDLKRILEIQDNYTEIVWKYLVYQYTYEQAIRRFSQLLRCLFQINHTIITVDRIQHYTDMIDTVVEKTEELLLKHE